MAQVGDYMLGRLREWGMHRVQGYRGRCVTMLIATMTGSFMRTGMPAAQASGAAGVRSPGFLPEQTRTGLYACPWLLPWSPAFR
jgi:hypothetical protein